MRAKFRGTKKERERERDREKKGEKKSTRKKNIFSLSGRIIRVQSKNSPGFIVNFRKNNWRSSEKTKKRKNVFENLSENTNGISKE